MKHKSPVYKSIKVSVVVPHCPKCKQAMHTYPFKCKCGEWKYIVKSNEFEVK